MSKTTASKSPKIKTPVGKSGKTGRAGPIQRLSATFCERITG
jgi:hypothetical protein